jgi:hypothetical protein
VLFRPDTGQTLVAMSGLGEAPKGAEHNLLAECARRFFVASRAARCPSGAPSSPSPGDCSLPEQWIGARRFGHGNRHYRKQSWPESARSTLRCAERLETPLRGSPARCCRCCGLHSQSFSLRRRWHERGQRRQQQSRGRRRMSAFTRPQARAPEPGDRGDERDLAGRQFGQGELRCPSPWPRSHGRSAGRDGGRGDPASPAFRPLRPSGAPAVGKHPVRHYWQEEKVGAAPHSQLHNAEERVSLPRKSEGSLPWRP